MKMVENKNIQKSRIKEINFGMTKDLPKEIREEYGFDDKSLYKEIIGEESHIESGLKDSLEEAGFEVITERLDLKRDGKHYIHQKGEKVYYVEDIKNIISKLSGD